MASVIFLALVILAIPVLISLAIFGGIQKGNKRNFEYLKTRLTELEERMSWLETAARRAKREEAAVPEAPHERPVSAAPEEEKLPAFTEAGVEPRVAPPVVEKPKPAAEKTETAPTAAAVPAAAKAIAWGE